MAATFAETTGSSLALIPSTHTHTISSIHSNDRWRRRQVVVDGGNPSPFHRKHPKISPPQPDPNGGSLSLSLLLLIHAPGSNTGATRPPPEDGGDAALTPMDSARPAGMSRRFSGIDFDDVFGGPPARSVFGGSADSFSSSGREAGDSLRASFGEKPVFGEPYSPASSRRKAPAEDFFSDIFGGGVSGGSTPRKLEWDILSPGRPPPPRTSSDAAASLLSPFSVTNYIERTQDFSASISLPHHVSTNMEDIAPHLVSSSIANEVHGTQADQRTLLQGDLSFRVFHDEYVSVETDDTSSIDPEGHFYEDATNLKDKKRTDHFHFSIYKWASRGVMLMMPSSPKEEKTRGRLSGLPMPYLHGVDLPLNRKNMPSSDRVFPSEVVRPNIASCRELSEATYRALHQTTETTCFQSERMTETVLSVESQVKVPGVGADLGAVSSKDCSNLELMQEEEISTLRKLLGLIKEHAGGKDGETSVKLEGPVIQTASEKIVDNLVGRKTVKESSIDQADVEKENSGYKTSKESFPGIAEGRVKDFVKIFNQDVSSKPTSFLEPRSWSFRAKDMEVCTQDHERLDINKLSSEDKLKSSSTGRDLSHEALMKKNANRDKLAFDANPEVEGIYKYSSEKPIIPSTESTSENIEDLYGDMEGPYFEVEEFMVEEVVFQLQNQDDPVTSEVNELQTLDAKIREWSAGKEGNIRSLLSTLQQVLWPGSGWKVVPLVDLIESSSVKKAYQRALLHLHPDKLQQRGALEHQKYIAEKVFDILQEAWTQFGSVSSI